MEITANHNRLAHWPGRLGALCLTLGLSLTAVPALSQAVDFEPVDNGPAGSVAIRWDGPITNLAWTGKRYATAESSFVGEPIVVPGDRASRTALVRNDGPSDAIATVRIETSSVDAVGPRGTANTELKDLIHLTWDVSGTTGGATWGEIARREGGIDTIQVPVARGQEFPITVGYYFPVDATTGQNWDPSSEVLGFTVRVQMEGDTAPLPTTGAAITLRHLLWGGILVAGGVALILGGRRQRSGASV